MNSDILVSISCITYNHSDYIRKALDGFLMQKTNFGFEILIHDDCSTDGTTEIVKEYEREYPDLIFPIYEQENQFSKGGPVGSIVWNVPRARGKYIALCEGDDYWTDPLKLQKQVDYMEKHEECAMTACASNWIKDGEFVKNDRISDNPRELTTEEVIRGGGGYLATCSLVFNNKKLNGVIPEWRRMANVGDYPLQIQGTLAGRLWYFPDCMCVYRSEVKGGWMSTNLGNNLENRIRHWQGEIKWMKELDKETNNKYQKAIYDHLLPLFHVLYKSGKVTRKEYLHSVFVVGGVKNYYRMMKDFAKCSIGRMKSKTD